VRPPLLIVADTLLMQASCPFARHPYSAAMQRPASAHGSLCQTCGRLCRGWMSCRLWWGRRCTLYLAAPSQLAARKDKQRIAGLT